MKPNMAFAAILLFLFAGCRMNCLDGHGPVHADDRDVSGFTGIRLNVPAEVTIQHGEFSFHLEAEDNLLSEIITGVKGGLLRISSDRCLKPNVKIRIRVSLPSLDELEINGSGDLLVPDTFQVDRIDLSINGSGNIHASLVAAKIDAAIHGSGDIRLTGSANEQKIKIAGSGGVEAAKLPCNGAEVEVLGSGSVNLYVIRSLEVKVNGSGDVHYKGKPTVSAKINGSGKVVDEN